MGDLKKIEELKPKQKGVDLTEVEVIDLSPVKKFSRMGAPGRVCTATIKDDTGKVSFTLWNEEVDKVSEGDVLNITDASVKEWRGITQVNTGRNGSFEKVD